MNINHIIRKQIFDLQLPVRDGAYSLQQEIRAVYDEELLPLIDQLFSEISGPGEILRINRLELNLGVISPLRLREQLAAQLKTVLTEKLLEARSRAVMRPGSLLSGTEEAVIIQGGELEMEAVLQTAAASVPSLLEVFFTTGNLPWWIPDETNQPDIAALTQQFLEEEPEHFVQLMMVVLKQRAAAERIVHQLPAPLVKRIAEKLWPSRLHNLTAQAQLEEVLRFIKQLTGISDEIVAASSGTPAPLTLIAAAAAARIVNLPAAHFPQLPAKAEPAGWLLFAAATAYNTEPDAVLKLAEAALIQQQTAQRINAPIPESIVQILLARLQTKTHSLSVSPLTKLIELIATNERISITQAEAELLIAQLPFITASAASESSVIRKLLTETAPLKRKEVQQLIADADTDLAFVVIQLDDEELLSESENAVDEIKPARKKTKTVSKTEKHKIKLKNIKQAVQEETEIPAHQKQPEPETIISTSNKNTLQEIELIEIAEKTEVEQLIEIFSDDRDEDEYDEDSATGKRHRLTRWGGLVLLGPYLPSLFNEAGYLNEENIFKNKEAAYRAVFLLHYICTGKTKAPEYALPLHKLLCGLPFNKSIPKSIRLTKKEKQEADDLLDAMAEQWSSLRSPFGDAIRQNFMQRTGIIERKDNSWLVRIQRTSLDILMDSLPWSISVIRLPWTQHLIQTEW
ncbi:MAG: contractile injection system tape measure protein [Bacteroidota bacterium]